MRSAKPARPTPTAPVAGTSRSTPGSLAGRGTFTQDTIIAIAALSVLRRDNAAMTSAPVSDLAVLLGSMQPELHAGAWAWCALAPGASTEGADAIATMREAEGLTVVVAEAEALARGWPVAFRSAWITLNVHSDLAAVGLTAAFARALGEAGVSCNVIAGVHHDHLFVPIDRAGDAMAALQSLQARSAA